MVSKIKTADDRALAEAAELLRAGELVAFPTETVYGLGADARSDSAIKKIYEAKGRPGGNPVIVHVASAEAAHGFAAAWPAAAQRLAEKFWPGPLTMIVRRGAGLSPLVSAGRETVALRVPSHPVAAELLRAFAGPIAAPSANRSGFTSPTTAQHVLAELGGRVPLVIDGGACAVGLESTVLDLSGDVPRILRPGAVTAEMLREVVGRVENVQAVVSEEDSAISPGLHLQHYAPRKPAFRFAADNWNDARAWADVNGPVALLTWSDAISLPAPHETMRLPDDAAAYARILYAAMREADDKAVAAILVLMPESRAGMWAAVEDRLNRATKPMST